MTTLPHSLPAVVQFVFEVVVIKVIFANGVASIIQWLGRLSWRRLRRWLISNDREAFIYFLEKVSQLK